MSDMMATLSSFPTALWSVLLGVVLVYWLASLLGMVDDWDISDFQHVDGHTEGMGDLAGKLMALGLGGVPFSLVLSIYALFGWLFSALIQQYLLWLPGWIHYVVGVGILLLSGILALPCTALLLRPLRGLFVIHGAARKADLVGQLCKISTMTVDEQFGRAEVRGSGAPFNIRVAASSPNALIKGSQALILEYDAVLDVYTIQEID